MTEATGDVVLDAEAVMKRILKLVLGAIAGLIALCMVGSIIGSRDREKQVAAAHAAAEKQVLERNRAVAALDPNLSGDQLVNACLAAEKAGGIPTEHAGRCSDAMLAAGKAALAGKHPADAVPLLEAAAKTATKKDEAQSALTDAKVALAVSGAKEDLAKAEQARTAKKFDEAAALAQSAQKKATEGQQTKPGDAELKVLAEKSTVLATRMKEEAVKAVRASREYLKLGPDALADAILGEDNLEEAFETKWQGRWVRWDAKFKLNAALIGHLFNAGTNIEMVCDSFDPSTTAKLESLKRWQAVKIEARFTRPAATRSTDNRFRLVFDECSF